MQENQSNNTGHLSVSIPAQRAERPKPWDWEVQVLLPRSRPDDPRSPRTVGKAGGYGEPTLADLYQAAAAAVDILEDRVPS